MKLSGCIVVYNNQKEALKAAQSVLAHTKKYPLTLYLVDNASPDGSGEELRRAVAEGRLPTQEGQAVEVICRPENGGFGTGHNTVLPKLDSAYHFIINPDITLDEDTLSNMADWMEENPLAVMARPMLYFPDGRFQELPLRRCSFLALVYRQCTALKFLKCFNDHYVMADEDLSAPREIEFCTGAFSLVRTDTFCKVGGFDEKYFMYVEDADLTQMMWREGKVYLLPQYRVYHAWHRAAHSKLKYFRMQLHSMGRYFWKWGFRL